MTADEGAKLAEAYRIPNALQENGAFGYVSEEFAKVPTRQVATGKDEAGRRTDSESLDTRALANLKPIGAEDALERASWLTDLLGQAGSRAQPEGLARQAHALRPRGQADERVRARHHGVARPHARRAAGHRPGREAAHHLRS